MIRLSFTLLGLCLAATLLRAARGGEPATPTDDLDFAVQGEYTGAFKPTDGNPDMQVGVQVIALGGGKFHGVVYPGGLPGAGWDGTGKLEAEGQRQGDLVLFDGNDSRGEIKGGVLRVLAPDDDVLAELKRVARTSPTLGAKPPPGAVALFDGTTASAFDGGRMTDDGLLMAGATSKRSFGDCQLHLEFLLPFMPAAEGQARGNSGCYLQGRYEVQMLDSFGLAGADNECGAIYGIKPPRVNMCFPPLAWQTYDIDYTAARYEGGKKVKNALITVKHNGVVVHDQVELPQATRAAPVAEGPEPGPLYLQDHGNPVRYRNVWLVEEP